MKPGYAEIRLETLRGPLLKMQVPGRVCLGMLAGFTTIALRDCLGVVEATVTTDDAEWSWSTDPLGAGDQMFRRVSSLEAMVR